jgi:tellurite resistance protein TerC
MIDQTILLWGGFTLLILALLALDLGVFQRKPHVIGTREAMGWFTIWTSLALVFCLAIFFFHERRGEAAMEFLTGFLVEKSLSIDNIFVFVLIFNFFRVPPAFQHRVLFLGIVGAIVLRFAFIVAGLALLDRFAWMAYVFGAFLVFTGISMMRRKEENTDPGNNWVIRTFRRFFPVTDQYDGANFFSRIDGRWVATPLFLVLLAIESTDIIFAVDSIPAIFAITREPFLVFTSNIFAMLGLRSLYFAVAGFMKRFHLLRYGFASIILILGVKMLVADFYEWPVAVSLGLIVIILLLCVIFSLLRPRADDLKMMFEQPEKLGLMPFRRLLLIENIVDLGELCVRDAMRRRSGVVCLQMDLTWAENLTRIREARFSRYPLLENAGAEKPLGLILLKDLALATTWPQVDGPALRAMARACPRLPADLPLEEAMARLQRGNHQMAIVTTEGEAWAGLITLEDILEEMVGKIGDEFDTDRAGQIVSLAEAITPGRVVLGVEAPDLPAAIEKIVRAIPPAELPADPQTILTQILQREATMTTYLGHGLAIPHCRLAGLDQPVLIFARAESGIALPGSNERVALLFMLLTPEKMARLQPRLLADIVGLIESDYVIARLRSATRPEEVIEAIRDGIQVALD